MIPFILIAVGGVMVFAGVRKENPLDVIKGVLSGEGVPTGGTAGGNPSLGTVPGVGAGVGSGQYTTTRRTVPSTVIVTPRG
jgi:hypothetical protein